RVLARPPGLSALAERAARARDPALLDELPRADVRLDLHPPDRGPPEPAPRPLRRRPPAPALQRFRGPARPGLRRAALHDPSPLRLPGEAGPIAAGSRRRPRGEPPSRPLARHPPPHGARDRGRLPARLHPLPGVL